MSWPKWTWCWGFPGLEVKARSEYQCWMCWSRSRAQFKPGGCTVASWAWAAAAERSSQQTSGVQQSAAVSHTHQCIQLHWHDVPVAFTLASQLTGLAQAFRPTTHLKVLFPKWLSNATMKENFQMCNTYTLAQVFTFKSQLSQLTTVSWTLNCAW